jgi:hypothetical protein
MKDLKTSLRSGVWPSAVIAEHELNCLVKCDSQKGLTEDSTETAKYRLRSQEAFNAAQLSNIPRCPSSILDFNNVRHQCMYHEGHDIKHPLFRSIVHTNMGVTWSEGASFFSVKSPKKVSARQAGEAQENEILTRFLLVYPNMVKTNVNAIGVDLQYAPDIDVQSKASHGVGPEDVSHFADSSEALLKVMVGLSFTKGAKSRAFKRGVTLLTLKEFRDRYPLPEEIHNVD